MCGAVVVKEDLKGAIVATGTKLVTFGILNSGLGDFSSFHHLHGGYKDVLGSVWTMPGEIRR